MNKNTKHISGIIEKKIENKTDNPKAPTGFLYLLDNEDKFTIWKSVELEKVIVGGEYEIVYTETENIYGNRTYKNYNVSSIDDMSIGITSKNISFSEEEIDILKDVGFDTSKIKIGESNSGFTILNHKVVIGDVKDIVVPKNVYNYLIQKKLNETNN